MVKKLITIDVEDKDLKSATKNVTAKKTNPVEKKEVEKFGIVEINNASSAKKIKNTTEKGFEKNINSAEKRTVKAKTSKVDDYFDFSFRTGESSSQSQEKQEKVEAVQKSSSKKAKTTTLKIDAELKNNQTENVSESVKFDNDAYQIIRVARIGSLFDCEKRMINA